MEEFDALVAEFMDAFGGQATLTTKSTGTYNVETGDYAYSTVNTQVEAILLDLILRSNGLATVSGTLVEQGDKRIFVRPVNKQYPLQLMPNISPTSDTITMAGKTWKIINVKSVNPSGTNAILFELIVKE